MSADTALRLGRYFGTSPEFWMDLQSDYELRRARGQVGQTIERAVRAPRRWQARERPRRKREGRWSAQWPPAPPLLWVQINQRSQMPGRMK